MQRRLHSPLNPDLLEKQFQIGMKKITCIVSLEIASLYKLEKGEKTGKKGELQNSRTQVLLKVPPRHPLLKWSCPFWQGESRNPSAWQRSHRGLRDRVKKSLLGFFARN